MTFLKLSSADRVDFRGEFWNLGLKFSKIP